MCRPPTFLYSTRSEPRPARSHSAAHSRTSSSRAPISDGAGPLIGTPNGSNSAPAAYADSKAPDCHRRATASRTSAGRVHDAAVAATSVSKRHCDRDLLQEPRLSPLAVLLDSERLQPG